MKFYIFALALWFFSRLQTLALLVSVTEDMTGHEGLQCAFGLRDIRCSASIAMLAKPMSMKYLLARSGKQRAGSKYLDICN